MRKVCIVTGTRAEWGLLSPLAALLRADPELRLQIIAANMHLSERYGMTVREIEAEGFTVDYRVPTEADEDSPEGVARSVGKAVEGFAGAYGALKPDLLVVLGDRYEILAAVTAALIFRIPVAHLHGGERTEGAFDDSIRHAVTKMSHLHFTAAEEYRRRVIQLGEAPETVFNVGAIGVDNIRRIPLWSREETERSLGGFALDRKTVLVTYHPETLGELSPEHQIEALLGALDDVPQLRVVFTLPNSDTGNRAVAERVKAWSDAHPERAVCFVSLGLKRYLSVLQYIGGVVGNSSSGIIEAPSFGIPTLDIGDRQKGRTAAASVVHCPTGREAIAAQLRRLAAGDLPADGSNPYEKPGTARRIYEILKSARPRAVKCFYDLTC